ncbi:odorant receptor Or1 [Tribolium castaneum]|uniref:Odorant receptor n=1 Tax=Tribolium castaneum TaxID=7070 RepID=D6X414_TRICA|nr:PREDICTED: odorant receptor Or1-like [Tribolium castaneum]EEZ97776.1 odorant receptor 67 [Tribolium castaneum]|eukprot:XP_015839443.1 PREDICTED: odorant receptor Or1-like [Tribolium castaneum]
MDFTIRDFDLRNSFSLERKLLLVLGFYPIRDKEKHRILHQLSAFLNLLLYYGQLLTIIIQMVIDRNDLSKLTDSTLYFLTLFTFLCKLFNFQYYGKDLIEVEKSLTDPIFYGYSFHKLQIIKAKVRSCTLVCLAFRISCTCSCFIYSVVPFIDRSGQKTLSIPGWFPYDTAKHFYITFFLQSLSLFISAHCNSATDTLPCKLISLATAQFELLKDNLRTIDYENSFEETKHALVKCITHHRKIVNYTKRVETIFSKGIFLQLFASVLVICTTGFQLVIVPFGSLKFAIHGIYLCAMTAQIAIYCYYGHDVMITSDEIGTSLYMSNWYASHIKIRKIMVIFLEKTKKPTIVLAGNFITLSLVTLTQILRSAYSYFAVLRRLYADD